MKKSLRIKEKESVALSEKEAELGKKKNSGREDWEIRAILDKISSLRRKIEAKEKTDKRTKRGIKLYKK